MFLLMILMISYEERWFSTSPSLLREVSHGGPVAALGVSSGAALQQLATQKLGVTEVEDQLLMMPGGAW